MIEIGNVGEFTVWVDDTKVIEKRGAFPDPAQIVDAVKRALP